MAIYIEMPKLSDTMTEGTLVKWLKNEGRQSDSGDVLAEVETDKATMEMEAFDDGILHKHLVPAGGKAPVGGKIACSCRKAKRRRGRRDDSRIAEDHAGQSGYHRTGRSDRGQHQPAPHRRPHPWPSGPASKPRRWPGRSPRARASSFPVSPAPARRTHRGQGRGRRLERTCAP